MATLKTNQEGIDDPVAQKYNYHDLMMLEFPPSSH